MQAYSYDEDPWPADHRAVVVSVDRVDKPGTVPRADLILGATCAAIGTTSALPELRICHAVDVLRFHFDAPSGKLKTTAPVMAFQCFASDQTLLPWSTYPASYLDPTKPGFEVLLIGSSFRAGGYSFSAKIPPGAAGVTCRLQGYAFHAGAKNGMFDASNAVDVELR